MRRLLVNGTLVVDLGRRELRRGSAVLPIGTQVFDILEVLLRAKGRAVSRGDLLNAVRGGIHINDDALDVSIAQLRDAFGPDRSLLQSERGRGHRLRGEWKEGSSEEKPRGIGLPEGTRLVGRSNELATLVELLRERTCVTLTGTGGIGKTRLAIEAVRRAADSLGIPAFFVDLAVVTDSRRVAIAVAEAIGLDQGAAEVTSARLAEFLGSRPAMLLLDNCEHVIEAAADLSEALLGRCAGIKVIATSREPLRLQEEQVWPVPALSSPSPDHAEISDIRESGAAALFLLRMEQAGSSAAPTEADLRVIAEICRRLDGLPLAIEFAAARADSLGVQNVLTRLELSLSILSGGRRTGLPRHRTMQAALDWSYQLLPDEEKRLLRCLGVFAGGFTLQAVTAVAGEGDPDEHAVLMGIGNLVTKSFVVRDAGSEPIRWRLLETVRSFALDQLSAMDELANGRCRHLRFYRQLAQPALDGEATNDVLGATGREMDNIRAALDWAFSPLGDTSDGVVLTAATVPAWLRLFRLAECAGRIEEALGGLDGDAPLVPYLEARARLSICFGLLNTDAPAARIREVLHPALLIAKHQDDAELRLRALWVSWSFHLNTGDYGATLSAARDFLATAEAADLGKRRSVGHRLLGTALHFAGDQHGASDHLGRALTRTAGARRAWFLLDQDIVARAMRSRILLLQGYLDEAAAEARLGLADAEASGSRLAICYAIRNGVCPVNLTRGDFNAAAQAADRLDTIAEEYGLTFWLAWCSCLRGQIDIGRGEHGRGVTLLQTGLAQRERDGWHMRNPEFRTSLAKGLVALGRLDEAMELLRISAAECEAGSQRWCLPEVWRSMAEILMLDPDRRPDARQLLERAVSEARVGGALLFELRSALSLHRLGQLMGGDDRTRNGLSSILARFVEGHDTLELATARDALAGKG